MADQGVAYPPPSMLGTNTTLFQITGANLNSTLDQALLKAFDFTKYVIDKIVFANASAPIINASGALYTGGSKSGIPLTASTQSLAGMDSVNAVVNPSLTAGATGLITDQTLFLSLTVPEGTPATADLFVMGIAGK